MEEKNENETTNFDNDLSKQLYNLELEYLEAKRNYDNAFGKLTLETNWDEVNEERGNYGLDKIKNAEQRKAYINQKCSSLKLIKEESEAKYHYYKNNFELLLAQEKNANL